MDRQILFKLADLIKQRRAADKEDSYSVTSTIDYLNVPTTMTLTVSSVSGTFQVGETLSGGTSGTTAKITNIDGTTIKVSDPTGYYHQSETLTGGTSSATATLNQAV